MKFMGVEMREEKMREDLVSEELVKIARLIESGGVSQWSNLMRGDDIVYSDVLKGLGVAISKYPYSKMGQDALYNEMFKEVAKCAKKVEALERKMW
jgi:hypothetical protein